jgi:HEPN domain-containing protein
VNRTDFQELAELRFQESKVLLTAGFPEGAYYLAGYAVECALKACIAKRTREYDFPDKKLVEKSYTHDLDKLIDAAGLSDILKEDIAENDRLEFEWSMVRAWSEQSRYELFPDEGANRGQIAAMMLSAVESSKGGVLRWIKQHW